MEFITHFGKKNDASFVFTQPSMTFQEFKDEVDINEIVARHNKTGAWSANPNLPPVRPFYDDLAPGSEDFHKAQTVIAHANQLFEAQPSHIRARFNNDPHALLRFVEDESNYSEAVRLGICRERERELVSSEIPLSENLPEKSPEKVTPAGGISE